MTLILFILILSILVFVHEFGHFLAAKRAGILVEEFGFGLPPRIWGKKIGETIYSINALPIGGFVKLYGEDGGEERNARWAAGQARRDTPDVRGKAYFEKSLKRRFSVLLGGVTMNALLAIVCFSVLYFVIGIPVKTGMVKIFGVTEGSPAKFSEIKEGDVVVSIDNQKVSDSEEFIRLTKDKAEKTVVLEIFREKDNPCQTKDDKVLGGMAPGTFGFECRGKNLLVSLIPRQNPPAGEGPLGVVINDTELRKFPWWQMPYLGVREGVKESLIWAEMTLSGLKKILVSLILQGQIPKDIAGPVGIFQITGQVSKAGKLAVMQFIGILSLNLAIINILPFPALDGGRLIFLGYELVLRKRPPAKLEAKINSFGMAFLLALMVLITINDIIRLVGR